MRKIEEVDPTLLDPGDKEEEEKSNKNYKLKLEEVILRRKEAARLRAQQVQKSYDIVTKRLYQ